MADLARQTAKNGGYIVCPFCNSRGGKFCKCQAISNDPRLAEDWHPDNPPATGIVRSSKQRYLIFGVFWRRLYRSSVKWFACWSFKALSIFPDLTLTALCQQNAVGRQIS